MTTMHYYDIIAHDYDALYNNNISLAENDIVKNLMLEKVHGKSELAVLDIGCGTGLVYEMLSSHSEVDYLGVDISETMVTVAKNKYEKESKVRFAQIDANHINHNDFKPQSFDIVSSTFGSFSYIHNPEQFLQRTLDLLKKDGIIFFMVYSRYSITNIRSASSGFESHSIKKKRPYEFRNSHCEIDVFPDSYFYTEGQLRSICSGLRFSSVDIHGLNYFLDHTHDKESYGYSECVDILRKEMSEMSGHKDLAHSLICIIKK